MTSPVKKVFITQRFGENPKIYSRFGFKGHNGIDFRAFLPNGDRCYTENKSEVFAPHSGKVIENALDKNGYGWYIKIENDKEGSVLAHFSSKSPIDIGTDVKEMQFVGFQGNTGNSTGIHLHWGYYRIPRDRSNGYGGFIDQEGLYSDWSSDVQAPKTTIIQGNSIESFLSFWGSNNLETLQSKLIEHIGDNWNGGFLGSARKKIQELEETVKNKDQTIKELKSAHQVFIDKASSILWSNGEPTTSDDASVIEKIREVGLLKDKVSDLEVELEKKTLEIAKIKQGYEEKLQELQDQLDRVRKEHSQEIEIMQAKHQKQIETIKQSVDKELASLEETKKQYNIYKNFINWIKKVTGYEKTTN